MKLRDAGEFGLIRRITEENRFAGDDAAVIPENDGYLLLTTDSMVDGVHFRKERHPPDILGMKLAASSLSDIAAMGGRPEYALVSIAMPPETDIEWVEALYEGMERRLGRYGAQIVGGDTVSSDRMVLTLALSGRVNGREPVTRSGASPGDLVFVSGTLGGSLAGLLALENGLDGYPVTVERHLAPECRLDISDAVSSVARAMMDISDGLASDVRHISGKSGVGVELYGERIPVHPDALKIADALGMAPLDIALSSGEEYELLFTVPEEMKKEGERYGTCIGRVFSGSGVVLDGVEPSVSGWEHFHGKEYQR